MTAEVFESVKRHDDDLPENTLSIDAVDHERGHLVYVDTNYKAERESEYPVLLSAVDAVKAARALVEAAARALNDAPVDPAQSWDLLSALSVVDAEVSDLRDSLLLDLKPEQS